MQEMYDNINLHLILNVIGAVLHQWNRMQEGGQKESHEWEYHKRNFMSFSSESQSNWFSFYAMLTGCLSQQAPLWLSQAASTLILSSIFSARGRWE